MLEGTSKIWRWLTIGTFSLPPAITSLVSAIHLYVWFSIGQNSILAVLLAIAFELLSIGSFVSITQLKILDDFARRAVWIAIFLLAGLQILGNVYSVFVYINTNSTTLVEHAAALFKMEVGDTINRWLSILLGSILPITSLFFLKILASYLMAVETIRPKVGRPTKEEAEARERMEKKRNIVNERIKQRTLL